MNIWKPWGSRKGKATTRWEKKFQPESRLDALAHKGESEIEEEVKSYPTQIGSRNRRLSLGGLSPYQRGEMTAKKIKLKAARQSKRTTSQEAKASSSFIRGEQEAAHT